MRREKMVCKRTAASLGLTPCVEEKGPADGFAFGAIDESVASGEGGGSARAVRALDWGAPFSETDLTG